MKIKDSVLLQVNQEDRGIEIIVADQMTEQELTIAIVAIVTHKPNFLNAVKKAI